jgi:hypothetical protein
MDTTDTSEQNKAAAVAQMRSLIQSLRDGVTATGEAAIKALGDPRAVLRNAGVDVDRPDYGFPVTCLGTCLGCLIGHGARPEHLEYVAQVLIADGEDAIRDAGQYLVDHIKDPDADLISSVVPIMAVCLDVLVELCGMTPIQLGLQVSVQCALINFTMPMHAVESAVAAAATTPAEMQSVAYTYLNAVGRDLAATFTVSCSDAEGPRLEIRGTRFGDRIAILSWLEATDGVREGGCYELLCAVEGTGPDGPVYENVLVSEHVNPDIVIASITAWLEPPLRSV